MYKGKLQPVEVIWEVSPSISAIRIETTEGGNTIISFNVFVLPELDIQETSAENPRVELTLHKGQCLQTHVAFNDVDVIDPEWFERDENYNNFDLTAYSLARREQWVMTKCSPSPGVYEVIGSWWLLSTKMERFNLRHIVIEGTDLWVEILCQNWSWNWASE